MTFFQRLIAVLSFFVIVSVTYLGSQKVILNYVGVSDVNMMLPGEERIPFLPVFIIVYVSFYILPVMIFMNLQRRGRLFKCMMAFLIAVVIHLLFFFGMPISYQLRPEVEWSSGVLRTIFGLLYSLDEPINTFPSMHVSFAFLCHYIVKRYFPTHSRATWIVALAVGFSTLFVKQHYVMDVLAGMLMAALINYFYICRSFDQKKSGVRE